jgi:hypothetical protein
LELADGLWSAHAGDDILALGVDEELAIEFIRAVGRVAGECDTGSRGLTGVAEDHGLHIDGCAPSSGDIVFAAIDDRAVVHPGTENSSDGAFELIPRVGGEAFSSAGFDEFFEELDEFLLVSAVSSLSTMSLVVFRVLVFVDDRLERLVVFAFALLHAEDDIAIHLNEAAVAIPREALVVRGLREREDGLIVEAEVEDRVHHARHGVASAGTDGYEEREAFRVAEFRAHDFFHVAHAGFHLGLEFLWIGLFVVVEIGADLCGNREAGRHGEADASHLGEVGSLAAEEGFHLSVAVGFRGSEGVNIFALFGAALVVDLVVFAIE